MSRPQRRGRGCGSECRTNRRLPPTTHTHTHTHPTPPHPYPPSAAGDEDAAQSACQRRPVRGPYRPQVRRRSWARRRAGTRSARPGPLASSPRARCWRLQARGKELPFGAPRRGAHRWGLDASPSPEICRLRSECSLGSHAGGGGRLESLGPRQPGVEQNGRLLRLCEDLEMELRSTDEQYRAQLQVRTLGRASAAARCACSGSRPTQPHPRPQDKDSEMASLVEDKARLEAALRAIQTVSGTVHHDADWPASDGRQSPPLQPDSPAAPAVLPLGDRREGGTAAAAGGRPAAVAEQTGQTTGAWNYGRRGPAGQERSAAAQVMQDCKATGVANLLRQTMRSGYSPGGSSAASPPVDPCREQPFSQPGLWLDDGCALDDLDSLHRCASCWVGAGGGGAAATAQGNPAAVQRSRALYSSSALPALHAGWC